MSGWWEWLLAIGRDHGVDPLVFAAIYIGGIPIFFASIAWLVRARRAGRSTVLPIMASGFCFCSAYLYLAIAGRDNPAWVWLLLGSLMLYGAWSTVRDIRRKTTTEQGEQ